MSSPLLAKRQPIPFGKYLLLDRINIGGMAEVWRAKESQPPGGRERLLAIKRILPNIAEDEEFIRMFIDEAKISVQLTHPNIAAIHDLGNIGSSYFITLEYIPGRDLRAVFDRCRKQGMPPPIAFTCHVISELCEGMDYAHRKKDAQGREMNIVHRDVSPQNVLLSYEGDVKVIDFGIAKAAGKATRTQAGILKGKFAYMSPEQTRGMELDRRADIFAIGICLHEMLTGERLFTGDSDYSVLERVRKADVPRPSSLNPKIPPALEELVLHALAREPEKRYPSAADLAEDLRSFLASTGQAFGRSELSAFMKGLFPEEVERELQRVEEYVGVKSLAELATRAQAPRPPSPSDPGLPAANKSEPGAQVAEAPVTAPSSPAAFGSAASGSVSVPPPIKDSGPARSLLPKMTEDSSGSFATVVMDREPFSGPQDTQTDPRAPVTQASVPGSGPTAVGGYVPLSPLPPSRSTSGSLESVEPRSAEDDSSRVSAPSIPAPASATAVSAPARSSQGAGVRAKSGRTADSDDTQSATGKVSDSAEPPTRAEPLASRGRSSPPRPASSLPPAPPPPMMASSRSERRILIGGITGLGLLLVTVVALSFRRGGGGTGYVVVDVPPEARGKVSLFVDGQSWGTPDAPSASAQAPQWPVVVPLPQGRAELQVEGPGFARVTERVSVEDTRKAPEVRRLPVVRSQPVVPVVVVASVERAQVMVEGVQVRGEGQPGRVWSGELELGKPTRIEVRRRGFRTFEATVEPKAGVSLEVMAELKALEFPMHVGSEPRGATVVLDGREVGRTPLNLRVPYGSKELVLRRAGYCEERISLRLSEVPGAPVSLSRKLARRPGC